MLSFTVQLPNLHQLGPLIEVEILAPLALEDVLRKEQKQVPAPIRVHAMVDTGATNTVVRQDIPEKPGLQPVGLTSISTPSSTNVTCYEYLVRLLFPNRVGISDFTVIAAPLLGQHIQCLVGRDVLSHGVFIYTGYMNMFTLSF